MADDKSFFSKVRELADTTLDNYIEKAKTKAPEPHYDRKSRSELIYGGHSEQMGYKEKRTMVGMDVLKTMATKDSVVAAIIQTRLSQIELFAEAQKDRYSPGWVIVPREPADFTDDQKLQLMTADDLEYKDLRAKFEEDRLKRKRKQDEDIKRGCSFIQNCGDWDEEELDPTKKMDFRKFLKIIVRDRLVYDYAAIEKVPYKGKEGMHHFYPVSAGTIRYASTESSEKYSALIERLEEVNYGKNSPQNANIKPYNEVQDPIKYIQLVRGHVVAGWTDKDLIFEAANPTADPEYNGYSMGELETLIQIITAHIYAETHNRNFFTQGVASKGILHIRGDNISRTQLEGFKRQWYNQLTNSRNAFRPPVIGSADEVKWVSLSQTNRDLEFQEWMHYLIRIICAVYQIDPAEINFDISKVNTSTLNESSNETRIKASRDKGLKPLLSYIQDIVNDKLIAAWDVEFYKNYKFEFVGLEAESKSQEVDRIQKETAIWKTVNEARIEMGYPPIDEGDIILNAAYTQYLQIHEQQAQAEQQGGVPGEEGAGGEVQQTEADQQASGENSDEALLDELNELMPESEDKKEETKKSKEPFAVEWFLNEEEDDDEEDR